MSSLVPLLTWPACLGCVAVAALEWLHIAYRVCIFVVDYRGELFMNHMGEETYAQCYLAAALAIVVAVAGCALGIVRPLPALQRRAFPGSLVLTVAAVLTLVILRWTGVLVEYREAHIGG